MVLQIPVMYSPNVEGFELDISGLNLQFDSGSLYLHQLLILRENIFLVRGGPTGSLPAYKLKIS